MQFPVRPGRRLGRIAIVAGCLTLVVYAGCAVAAKHTKHDKSPTEDDGAVSQIVISMASLGHIDPHIFGVNYVWDITPARDLPDYARTMSEVAHYHLVRYPGGWAGEAYDWLANRHLENSTQNRPEPKAPGPDPETLLAAVPEASFVTHSAGAIKGNVGLDETVRESANLVRRYGDRVHIWEIGNEWWLQRGGAKFPRIRQENLRRYAEVVAQVAPAMKAANPNIDIYASVDWLAPEDAATLRDMVGPAAWAKVDGITVHAYVIPGDQDKDPKQLAPRLQEIRHLSGKEKIYDSEWSVTNSQAKDDYGIHNAGWTMLVLRDLGRLHVTAASYWPAVTNVPRLAFTAQDYSQPFATGIVFGWMSRYYHGDALGTTGDIPSAAAKDGGEVTVIAATQGMGKRIVRIPLAGTGLTKVVSAEVMYSDNPNLFDESVAARTVHTASLLTSIDRGTDKQQSVRFEVNPGTAGRGTDAEIVRVTLK